MVAVRQRLLLVAGWLVAVIGSVLIASGAVAIAGGQVLDRPLRPLTAAEVAALPVVAVGLSNDTEPHASGGDVRTTGESTVGSAETETDQTGPTSTGGSAGFIDREFRDGVVTDSAVSDGVDRSERFTRLDSAETQVISLEAGKASFALDESQLHVLWVTPGSGFVAHTVARSEESVTISFSSSREVWLVTATVVDGGLTVESVPTSIS